MATGNLLEHLPESSGQRGRGARLLDVAVLVVLV